MKQANAGRFRKGQSGNPSGKRKRRADAISNPFAGYGTSSDRRRHTAFNIDLVTDDEARDLWRSEWLARVIIEARPTDAFRRGYDLVLDDKEIAQEVEAVAEELRVDDLCSMAGQYERAFGGSALFPVINDGGDLSEPLDEDSIDRIEAILLLEPRELTPRRWYRELASPKFGRPETYSVTPIASRGSLSGLPEIHESRLIIFPGKHASKQTQIGQREGWGDSVLAPVRQIIADYGMAWSSAATLVSEFAQGVMKKDGLMELLGSKDGLSQLDTLLAAQDMAASSMRTKLIDSKDDFIRQTTPISGLDGMMIQFAQLVAAAAGMPVTRIMGMSPAGLNATGEADIRNWYDEVERAQAREYRWPVERLLRLIMLSTTGPTGGKEPDVWSLRWRPLWSPSEKETADARYTQAQTDAIYFDRDIIDGETIAKARWGGDTYSFETPIDWKEREAQAAVVMTPELAGAALPGEGAPTVENVAGASVAPTTDPGQPPPEDTALNGAQVTSLVEVIRATVAGEIPRESAAAIVQLAFRVPPDKANALLGPPGFKPTTAPDPAGGGAPKPAPEPTAELTPAPAERADDRRAELVKKLSPDGICAACEEATTDLEIDHVEGRDWDPAALSADQRITKYEEEHAAGVKLRALCRSCNASDGAANKQTTRGPRRKDGTNFREVVRIGLGIRIENEVGSVRRWKDADGTEGETVMKYAYGFIWDARGADGEDVDVYLGPVEEPDFVYVVHQQKKSAEFAEYDEDKVMLGWADPGAAMKAYLEQYDDPRFFGGMSMFPRDVFIAKLRSAGIELGPTDVGKVTHGGEA